MTININLNDFPRIDPEKEKKGIIKTRKSISNLTKISSEKSKPNKCYYCGKTRSSFCNSHTLPVFCIRKIADNGKVLYSNSVLEYPFMDKDIGVNKSGTFHLLCRDCDSKIFQLYEDPSNYIDLPSSKMLAQIDMKTCLRNISKESNGNQLFELQKHHPNMDKNYADTKIGIGKLNLTEQKKSFTRAKNIASKTNCDDYYYIGYYKKLPYKVPLAIQCSVSLFFDLDGRIINNLYLYNPKYEIKSVNVCVFPFDNSSIVMLFVDSDNKMYRTFFKQLKKLSLQDQLSIINYIIFSYSEDFFLSPKLDKDTISSLAALVGKTPEMINFPMSDNSVKLSKIKKLYDYSEHSFVPNLLSEKYALTK